MGTSCCWNLLRRLNIGFKAVVANLAVALFILAPFGLFSFVEREEITCRKQVNRQQTVASF